eukprot:gb/GECG01012006.1/.p1 GENE.gb/GECG01012006.1/~~gb/GECG01012006.1/.p1  ORF type:complete len:249 (+),score=18.53 gb/GECG01012006.1/:1-747(+)
MNKNRVNAFLLLIVWSASSELCFVRAIINKTSSTHRQRGIHEQQQDSAIHRTSSSTNTHSNEIPSARHATGIAAVEPPSTGPWSYMTAEDALKNLFEEVRNLGADVSSVKPERDAFGGWELVSTRPVKKGQVVFEVPRRLCIHGSNATTHPVVGPLYRMGIQKIKNFDSARIGALNGMILLLHYEAFYNFLTSPWKAFIATLPQSPAVPSYYSGDDAKLLDLLDEATGVFSRQISLKGMQCCTILMMH